MTILLLVVAWLFASYIFYRRYPNYMRAPNFYAEDGQVFAKNILFHGFWHALFTTFNGYYIWGIYILQKIAFILNSLLYGGELATLPKAIALTSYTFLGFIAVLPALLFRKYLSHATLLLIFLFTLFVPLIGSDYTLVGTLGTMKFAFVYIAFLLLACRHMLPDESRKFYLIDAFLVVCLYTNTTVYFMMPFALLRYLPRLRKKQFVALLKTRSVQSLAVLGLLALPQLYVIHKNGIPPLPGYLDNPFNPARAIEIFLSRSYTYAVLFPINKYLNDAVVVIALALFTASGFFLPRRHRFFFVFGYASIFLASALFILKRTGVSDYFFGYKSGGPDQFFFAQNWIFTFILSMVIVAFIGRLKAGTLRHLSYAGVVLMVVCFLAPHANTYGRNNFEEVSVGNIYQNAQVSCRKPGKTLDLAIYPSSSETFKDIPRQLLCTKDVLAYQPAVVDLNLRPSDNNYLSGLGTHNVVNQTFVSPRNNLNGVIIYFSTFATHVRSPYDLLLYTGSCTQLISRTSIHVRDLQDNLFHTVMIPEIHNSAKKTYCFSVRAHGDEPQSPLAVQLSRPNAYMPGKTTINGKASERAVVFELHYKEVL